MKKKKVLINTDYPLVRTGLGRNGKELANYLYRTGKYEVYYYACGVAWDNLEYTRFPYKMCGALPNNPQEVEALSKDPGQMRAAAYGSVNIDKAIQEFKPDVAIFSNDSWAMDGFAGKVWWDKIHCVPHVTLDSLPFLPQQTDFIKKSKNFLVWAEFAEKESKRLGFNHVRTLTGMINEQCFYRFSKQERFALRSRFGIPQDAFITGFVFRNQLRKELKPLMEGFAQFKKENPKQKAYLLLHTHFSEPGGWDIPRFCNELGIDKSLVLTTYVCKSCHNYQIKPYTEQDQNCPYCGSEKTQTTPQVTNGVTETELNQIYNLMDLYCHPFNAGGLEMPLVEALYAGLPLATNGYSSGEMFTEQDFVLPIDFIFGVQGGHGTQFKRAVPSSSSIKKIIGKVVAMSEEQRLERGRKGREWALSKFSIQVVGKQWEDFIDSLPEHNWDFNFSVKPKNPTAVIPEIADDGEWITKLYSEILDMTVDANDSGYQYWTNAMKNGMPRDKILAYFRHVAATENAKNTPFTLEHLLDNTGRKRLLIVAPEAIGDLLYLTSLMESFEASYAGWDIYVATKPEYFEIFDGITAIHKVIPYLPIMDHEIQMTGAGQHKGFFDAWTFPAAAAQKFLNYLTNNNIVLSLRR